MPSPLELLAGLLERDGAVVTAEDFAGPAGPLLHAASASGFLGRGPVVHPCPSCPHCAGCVPRRAGGRLLCPACRCEVEEARLWCRLFDREAFLGWLAGRWGLRGEGVRRLDAGLWHLGAWGQGGRPAECFYRGPRPPSAAGLARLAAYRSAVLLGGLTLPRLPTGAGGDVRRLALIDLLRWDGPSGTLDVAPAGEALAEGRRVRFDTGGGGLWAGGELLGEVPVGSREFHLLNRLAAEPDRYVPYDELKHEVCLRGGSTDAAGEAAFCHALKRRIKQRWVPRIDELLVTTNKGDGYRLRSSLPG